MTLFYFSGGQMPNSPIPTDIQNLFLLIFYIYNNLNKLQKFKF